MTLEIHLLGRKEEKPLERKASWNVHSLVIQADFSISSLGTESVEIGVYLPVFARG
jgi:hypothetical protein